MAEANTSSSSSPILVLYNTMTKQKEVFKPKEPGKVKMYVCGITAYDFSHIGHARAYVAFDVLYRYLRHLGYDVLYVRNFTDVDDKIIERAKGHKVKRILEKIFLLNFLRTKELKQDKLKADALKLSDKFCKEFIVDMKDLQCLDPTVQPRVSENMDQIRHMIAKIIENDCAYVVNGDVYFSVDKFPNYGKLSGRKMEDNRAGERVAIDSRKRNPADFALWKAAKPDEPSWDSPWGPGRPGWHIECSAMSERYLTFSFDIHGGGMDLKFPHHENELAQSCAACLDANVTYWLHNGFVTNNNEKMSKSKGNFFTIREVYKLYHPLALRYFLMRTHYRSPVNYSISEIEIASDAVFYMYQTLQDFEDALKPFREETEEKTKAGGKGPRVNPAAQECIKKLKNEFQARMSDDMSTPAFLNSTLQETFRFINSSLKELKKKMQKPQQLSLVSSLIDLEKQVKEVLNVLGLLPPLSYKEVLQQLKGKALARAQMNEEGVQRLIEKRTQARKNKNFSKSDQIRLDLAAKGIALMDIGKDTIWRPALPEKEESSPTNKVIQQIVVQQIVPVAILALSVRFVLKRWYGASMVCSSE